MEGQNYERPNERIVGLDESIQELAAKERDSDRERPSLYKYAEVEFSEDQKKLVSDLISELRGFLGEYHYGGDFPLDRIHIMDKSKLTEEDLIKVNQGRDRFSHAIYVLGNEQIYLSNTIMSAPDNIASIALVLGHELIHAASFRSRTIGLKAEKPGIVTVKNRRLGLLLETDKLNSWKTFNSLNEAVTDRLAEKFLEYMVINPDSKIKLDSNGGVFKGHTYRKEKDDLEELMYDLYEKNRSKPEYNFIDVEDVFKIFVDAMINGQLLPLARLIEGTYGRGSFS